MLTLAKIRVYRKYGGDIDGFARAKNQNDYSVITDDEWFLIDSLVQKLFLVRNGKAPPEYAKRISVEVHQNIEGEEAINELMELA
jgi:hypothetical protein